MQPETPQSTPTPSEPQSQPLSSQSGQGPVLDTHSDGGVLQSAGSGVTNPPLHPSDTANPVLDTTGTPVQLTPATTEATPINFHNKTLRRLLLIASVLVIVLFFSVGGWIAYRQHAARSKATGPGHIGVTSIDLSGIKLGDAGLSTQQLSVNGLLKINSQAVITPTARPTNPAAGLIYLDKTNQTLYLYDGATFQPLAGASVKPVLSVQGETGAVNFTSGPGIGLSGTKISNSGVLSLQGLAGTIGLAGSGGISFGHSGNNLLINLPQDLSITASPTFNDVNFASGSFESGGITFLLPSTGSTTQTICTSGVTCAAGGGLAVVVGPGVAQVDTSSNPTIFLNKTSSGNLIEVQNNGTDTFVVDNAGNTHFGAGGNGTLYANALMPSGALSLGATGQQFTLQGNNGSSIVAQDGAGHQVTVDFAASGSVNNDVTYYFDRSGPAGAYAVCTAAGNCGSGASAVQAPVAGTVNQIAKFTAGNTIGDSSLSDNGTTVTAAGNLTVNSVLGTNTITPTSALTIGATTLAFTLQGSGTSVLTANNGAGNTTTLKFATPSGTNNIILPANGGTVAVAGGGPLSVDSTGTIQLGTVGVANGGTGNSATPSNGQLLIGNGSGFTLASLTAGTGIVVTPGAGSITLSTNGCPTCANTNLNNLAAGAVALNTTLQPAGPNDAVDLGSSSNPFRELYLWGTGSSGASIKFTGAPTSARTITIPDTSGTVAVKASGNINLDAVTGNITFTGQLPIANGGTNANNAAGARTNLSAAQSGANSDITSITSPGGLTLTPSSVGLTAGAVTLPFTLQGNASSLVSGKDSGGGGSGFTTSLGYSFGTGGSAPTSNVTYLLQNNNLTGGGTYNICTTAGNCNGGGSGAITGSGTAGTIAKFTGSGFTLGDSALTDNGTNLLSLNSSYRLAVTGSPAASATSSLLALGGNIAGGNASVNGGTYIGVNAPSSGAGSAADLLNLQNNGTSEIKVTSAGNTTINGTLTVASGSITATGLATGIVTSTSGLLGSVTVIPIANGGTNTSSAIGAAGALAYSDGTKYVFNTAGSSGQILKSGGAGAPTFDNLANIILVTGGSNNLTKSGTTSVTLDIRQDPTFTTSVTTPQLSAAANLLINPAGTLTITPGGLFTAGSTTQKFILQGTSTSVITTANNGHTVQVGFTGTAPGDVTYNFDATGAPGGAGTYTICTTAGNCLGGGGGGASATGSGNTGFLPVFTSDSNITKSFVSQVAGTNTLTIAGPTGGPTNTSLVIGAPSTGGTPSTGQIVLQNSSNIQTVTLASGTTSTGYTLTLPTSLSGGGCLSSDGFGVLTFQTCLSGSGGSGVIDVNGQAGNVIIDNAVGATNHVTINDANVDGNAAHKGIAVFNATDFRNNAGSGIIDTIQGIATTSSPTFTGLTLSGLSNGIVTASSGVLGSTSLVSVAQGGTGIGTFATNGVLYGNGTSAIQATAAGTNGQCLVANGSGIPVFGSCVGAATTLQAVYDNSPNGNIVLNSTVGPLSVQDASSPLGTSLFNVASNGGGTKYLNVTASGLSVTGTTTSSGNLTVTAGGLTVSAGGIAVTGNSTLAGNLTFGTSDTLKVNNIAQTAGGQNVSINAGSNNLTLTAGAAGLNFVDSANNITFTLPTTGASTQTICTQSVTCVAGGGTAVLFAPGATPQTDGSNNAGVFLNKTSATGNLLQLRQGAGNGSDRFVVDNSGNLTVGNGGGGTVNANTITPSGAFTLGATTQTFTLQGNGSSTAAATDVTTGFKTSLGYDFNTGGNATGNVTYNLQNNATIAPGSYILCFRNTSGSTSNCSGAGGGVTTDTSSNTGFLAYFDSGDQIIGKSVISQSGGAISVAGNLSLGTANTLKVNNIAQTANGQNVSINAGVNNLTVTAGSGGITFTDGSNSFLFPTSGGLGQTICTSGITCATGGGTAVLLGPNSTQTNTTGFAAINIKNNPNVDFVDFLNASNTNVFKIDSTGTITAPKLTSSGGLTLGDTTQQFLLQGSNTSSIAFTNTGQTVQVGLKSGTTPSGGVVYQLDSAGGTLGTGTYEICTTAKSSACTTTYAAGSGNGNYIQNGTTIQATANFAIQSAAAGSIGGVIRGAASQTADLLQVQNSGGTALAGLTAAGNIYVPSTVNATGSQLNLQTAGTTRLLLDNTNANFEGLNIFNAEQIWGSSLKIAGNFSNAIGVGTGVNNQLLTLQPQNSLNVVSVLQGATSQSGDLQQLQNSSAQVLAGFNNIGNLYLGRASAANGVIQLFNSTNGNSIALTPANSSTSTFTITVPGETGTLCTTAASVLCTTAYAAGSGNGNYIQNGTSPQTADYNITGNGTIGGSLRLAGSTSFPVSPVAGQIYYRTDNKQLYVYENGQWQADRSTATEIVSTTTTQNKEKADFVGDGTNDQTAINAAISALPSTGGSIVLLDGTYNIASTVTINKSNVNLVGSGNSTVLKRMYNEAGANVGGVITIAAGGTSISGSSVSNLQIAGNSGSFASGNDHGIFLSGGCGPTASSMKITGNWVSATAGNGIYLYTACSGNILNDIVTGNTVSGAGTAGIFSENAAHDSTISGNTSSSNGGYGIYMNGSIGSTISGNITNSNGTAGIYVGTNLAQSNFTGNTMRSNTTYGMFLGGFTAGQSNVSGNLFDSNGIGMEFGPGSINMTFTGNTVTNSVNAGVNVDGGTPSTNINISANTILNSGLEAIQFVTNVSNSLISGNYLSNNTGSGSTSTISLCASGPQCNNNQIVGNQIFDSAGTGFAIKILQSNNTYLSNNTYSGTGAASISDAGKGTVYANQLDANANLVSSGQAGIGLNTNSPAYSLQNTGAFVQGGMTTPAAPTVTASCSGTCATTWGYKVTAYDGLGETLASSEATASNASTLDATHFNTIVPARVPGAISYKVYRTTVGTTPNTIGLIGTIAGGAATFSLDDKALSAGAAVPAANSTGQFQALGSSVLFKNSTNSATAFQVQDSAGTSLLAIDTSGGKVSIKPTSGSPTVQFNSTGLDFAFGATSGGGSLQTKGGLISSGGGSIYAALANGTTNGLRVDSTGIDFNYGTTTGGGTLDLKGGKVSSTTASNITLTVQGASSQTADLLQIQNASNQALSGFNSSGNLYLGRNSSLAGPQTGTITFSNVGGAGSALLQSAATANAPIFNLPDAATAQYTLCYKDVSNGSNCAGSGSGVTGSGTATFLPVFTGSGTTVGNSFVSQDTSTNTLTVAGPAAANTSLVVGNPFGGSNPSTGQIILQNATNTNTITLRSPSGGSAPSTYVLTLPTTSASGCLSNNGSGILSFQPCLSGSGTGNGVTDLNGISGSINIQGTTHQVIVNTAGGPASPITLSTPQNIDLDSTPQFATLSLGAVQGSVSPPAATGQLNLFNSGSANKTIVKANAVTGGSDQTITLPNNTGTVGVVFDGGLSEDALGHVTLGTVPINKGGTGLTGTPTNGQLLIGNGSGYTLGNITNTGNDGTIVITNTAGGISLSAPGGGSCLGCASVTLNNLTVGAVALNTDLQPATSGSTNLGTTSLPFGVLNIKGTGSNAATLTASSTTSGQSFILPNNAGANNICIQQVLCTNYAPATGSTSYLNKNNAAGDTSNASVAGNLYGFTNSNAGAAGVLSLANSGTNAALSVTQTGVLSAPQAAILVNNNSGTHQGNLVDLQYGGTSQFKVDTNGNIQTLNGVASTSTYNTNTFNGSTLTFGNNAATSTITSGTGQSLNLTGNGLSTFNTTAGEIDLSPFTGVLNLTNSTTVKANAGLSINGGAANTLGLGDNAVSNTIQIGTAAISTGNTQNINIGNTNLAGTTNVAIGTGSGATSGTTTIQSAGTLSLGNGISPTINIQGNAGGTININTGNNGAGNSGNINIGAGSATGTAGGVIVKDGSNSNASFQVQNAAGTQLLNLNTLTAGNNLISNPSFEANSNGWLTKASTSIAASTDATKFGNQSLKIVTSGATQGAAFDYPFAPGGVYSISMWVETASGSPTATIGRQDVSGTDINSCTPLAVTTSWTQITCTNFTVGGTVTSPSSLYITFSTAGTYYIDGVTLVSGATSLNYAAPANNLQVDALYNNLTLNSSNTGDIQPWQLNAYPAGCATANCGSPASSRAFVSVTGNGYIYQIGGIVGGAIYQASVYYAKLNADGSTGPWTATTSLPDTIYGTGRQGVIANGYVYVIGGSNASSAQSTVYYAKLNANGTVGSWRTNQNALPATRQGQTVISANGFVYVIGGSTDGSAANGQKTVYYAKLNADGSTGVWQSTTQMPSERYTAQAVVANGYIYELGGVDIGSSATKTVYYAQLNSDGTVGAWTSAPAASQLPSQRNNGNSFVSNGYVYYVAGSDSGGSATNSVFYAKLNADGSTGAWSTSSTSLPAIRTATGYASANGYFYIWGGTTAITDQSNVFYTSTARILAGGSLDLVGLGGQSMAGAGGTGGSLTANDGTFVGNLNVLGNSTVAGTLSVDKDFRAGGSALFQNAGNSNVAFQVQNAAGTTLLNTDTVNSTVSLANNTAPYALSLPGTSGNYASTPTSANNQITGDIDLRARVALNDWTPTNVNGFIEKHGNTNISYQLTLASSGALQMIWSADGSTPITKLSTTTVPANDGQSIWIRATLQVNNGSGQNVVNFYTAPDSTTPPSSWTQLGSTVTTAGTTSIFNSAEAVEIGSQLVGTANLLTGTVYRAQIYSGINGTLKNDFDPTRAASTAATTLTASTGETWTRNTAGSPAATFLANSGATFGTNQANINTGTVLHNNSTTISGLIIQGAVGQTADLQDWQDPTGTIALIGSGGGFRNGSGTQNSFGDVGGISGVVLNVTTAGNPTYIGQVIRGAVSQSGDLLQFQNSTPAILSGFDSNGQLYLGRAAALTGTAKFYNSTVGATGSISIQPANPGASNIVLNLPADTTGSTICTNAASGACSAAGGYVQLAPASAQTDGNGTSNSSININKTGSGNLLTLAKGGTTVASIGNTGDALFRTSTNSATAFQIQNAASTSLLAVNDLTTNLNLLANSSMEGSANGWTVRGSATVASSTDFADFGSQSLKIVTNTVASNGAQYNFPFAPSTQYSLSFYARRDTGTSTNTFSIGRADNGSDTDCLTTQTINAGWLQFSCTFTTGATIGSSSNFYIKQTDIASDNIYLDGVTLVTGATAQAYIAPARNLQVDALYSNVTLNPTNNGEVGPWQLNANPIPAGAGTTPQQGNTVTANGYVYYMGGTTAFNNAFNTIYYAKLNADGSTGTFSTEATNPLPQKLTDQTSVVANGYLYVIGGARDVDNAYQSATYYAKLNANGSVGSWTTSSITGLPAMVFASSVVVNGYIYVLGGQTGSSGSPVAASTVYYAKLGANGSLSSSWSSATSLPNVMFGQTSVVANGYVYAIGGAANSIASAARSTIYYGRPDATGNITSWATNPIDIGCNVASCASGPAASKRIYHISSIVNGYVYVIGGQDPSIPANYSTVYYAKLNADGSTGAWTSSANATPIPLIVSGSATANGYIYGLGGGGFLNTVYYTSTQRIQASGSLDLVGGSSQSLSDPGGGGSLTAGNTNIVGDLQVQGMANFLQGVAVNNGLTVNAAANSTSTLAVQNAAGTTIFGVDTSNTRVGIATSAPSTDLSFGSTGSTTARVIGVETQTTATTGGTGLTLKAGTANGAAAGGLLTLQGGAASATAGSNGGNVAITAGAASTTGAGGAGGAVSITATDAGGSGVNAGGGITLTAGTAGGGFGSLGGGITLQAGTGSAFGAAGAVSVNGGNGISGGVANGGSVTIQGGAGGTTSGNGGAVSIQGGSSAGGVAGAINIGTTQASEVITIGNTSSSTITLESGSAASAIQIGNGATTHSIAIGTSASALQSIGIGSTNASSVVAIEGGTSATGIAIGNGATAHGIQIGTGAAVQTVVLGSTNTTSATSIQGGTGGSINIGSVGSSTLASTTHIADTTSATGAQAVTIGSKAANASNITTIQGGTASSAISLITAAAGGISIATGNNGAGNSGSITLGAGTATGTAGGVLVKNLTNSTTAFQVQNAAGTLELGVNTTNNNVVVTSGSFGIGLTDAGLTTAIGNSNSNAGAPSATTGSLTLGSNTNNVVIVNTNTSSGTTLVIPNLTPAVETFAVLGTAQTFTATQLVKLTSATAFRVQNAGGTNQFIVNSSTGAISANLGTGTATFDVCAPTNGGGLQVLTDCSSTTPADFAEIYPAAANVAVGDVVAQGSAQVKTYETGADGGPDWNAVKGKVSQVVKAATPYSNTLIGVASDNYSDRSSAGYNIKDSDNPTSVALVGRVNVKVTTENGDIEPGDSLTASATHPGYAMKATQAGYVIGQALSSFSDSTPGQVMVFVRGGYYPGPSVGTTIQNGGDGTLTNLNVTGSADVANLNVSGTSTLANLTVTGVTTLASLTVNGSATFNGTLSVNGHIITGNTSGNTTAAAGPEACTAPTVSVSGNDTSGTLTITTGTGCVGQPTPGVLATVTFANAFATPPKVVLSPAETNAAKLQYFTGTASTSNFTIDSNSVPANATTYKYNYLVVQ